MQSAQPQLDNKRVTSQYTTVYSTIIVGAYTTPEQRTCYSLLIQNVNRQTKLVFGNNKFTFFIPLIKYDSQ